MGNRLQSAFNKAIRGNDQRNTYRAVLGDNRRRLNSGRAYYVWARVQLPDGLAITEVLCTNVAPTLNLPVLVHYNEDNILEVKKQDPIKATAFYGDLGIGNTGPHAASHGRLAPDALRIDPLQIRGLLVTPTDPPTTAVKIDSWFYQTSGTSYGWWPSGTVELSGYIPQNFHEQRPILVGYNRSNGSPQVIAGTTGLYVGYTPYQIPFTGSDVAAIIGTVDFEAAAAVRLRYGMGTVENYDIFLDARRWVGGGLSTSSSSSGSVSGQVLAGFSQLRLTNQSTIANSSSMGSQATIYLHPFTGNGVGLYNTTSSEWELHQLTSTISLSISGLTASLGYDIFLYDNSGTLTLEAVAWTNATTRATALGTQDDVAVKSSDHSHLHIASILIDTGGGAVTFDKTLKKYHIWNRYNRTEHVFRNTPSIDSWTKSDNTIQPWNNDGTTHSVSFFNGESQLTGSGETIKAWLIGAQTGSSTRRAGVALSTSSSSLNSDALRNLGQLSATTYLGSYASFAASLGQQIVYMMEYADGASGSATLYGDAGVPTIYQVGMYGTVWL